VRNADVIKQIPVNDSAAEKFVPVDAQERVGFPRSVEWYVLIRDMEELRRRTGLGLEGCWREVLCADYVRARRCFDDVVRWQQKEQLR
jgi:hypothetical protein